MLIVGNLVKVPHKLRSIEWLTLNIADFIASEAVRVTKSLVFGGKGPASVLILARSRLPPCGVNYRHADGFLKALHVDHLSTSIGPGTSP